MCPSHSQRVFLFAILFLAAGACPCAFSACADEDVRVSVVVILATDKGDKVDPRLVNIAKLVQEKHPKLTSFRLARMACKPVDVGTEKQFELVEDQSAKVTVTHAADEKNKVGLKVKAPRLGEITYTTCCGKFFPLVTEYKTKNGERLIIAVRVQPCKEK
jgi:hypothetical protein